MNRYPIIASYLKNHVYKISHEIGNRDTKNLEKLNKTADYIKKELEDIGYVVEFQNYEAMAGVTIRKVKNIIARHPNFDKDTPFTVVGAHYDTCNNPGADDNTSGMAGVIEIARELYNSNAAKNIEFVLFVNEEPPFFKTDRMGSMVYVKNAIKEKQKIKQAIILEMIGYYKDSFFSQRYPIGLGIFYPNKGNFIAFVGNKSSKPLVNDLKNFFKGKSPLFVQKLALDTELIIGLDYSDHYPFWLTKYAPAMMVTDTSFFRNNNYHQDTDTYDTLDYERMSELVKGIAEFLKKEKPQSSSKITAVKKFY